MIDVPRSSAGAVVFLGIVTILLISASLEDGYYAPVKGVTATPKPTLDVRTEESRTKLRVKVEANAIGNVNVMTLESLSRFYGIEPNSTLPCSVRETWGADADVSGIVNEPLSPGQEITLCLN